MTFFLFLFLSLFLSFFLFPYSFNWGQSYQYCYRIFNQFQKVIGKSLTIINNQPHIYRSYIITLNIYIYITPIQSYSQTATYFSTSKVHASTNSHEKYPHRLLTTIVNCLSYYLYILCVFFSLPLNKSSEWRKPNRIL